MQEIEKLVEIWKSEVLSAVCLNGCDHICCSMNFDVTEEQLKLYFNLNGNKSAPLRMDGKPMFREHSHFGKKKGMFRTNFEEGIHYCPQLTKGLCKIYDHPLRSSACRNFPFSIDYEDRLVAYNKRCPGVEVHNMIDFLYEISLLGYTVGSTGGLSFAAFTKNQIIRIKSAKDKGSF